MGRLGTVLVIDDQEANLAAVRDALAPIGYTVETASDGQTGIAAAVELLPDVILLDVVMPAMDGFEVCRKLKENEETRLLPVVFLTGLDTREARLKALEVGATDFLSKPFDLVELEVRVRNLVAFRRLIQDLDSAEQILFAVARAVEARDEGTGEHCERLSRLAALLGETLGLDEESLKALRRAGYLHDIGKIGIPDAILNKRGKLSPEEWAVMRSHVGIGVGICSPLRALRSVIPIIRCHHEHRDGSGYPEGLLGEQIPYLARVFQVVDVYDALTSDRPYRAAMNRQAAVATLRAEAARGWWDGEIVEAFAKLVAQDNGGGALRQCGAVDVC